jgi:hypothetical protein
VPRDRYRDWQGCPNYLFSCQANILRIWIRRDDFVYDIYRLRDERIHNHLLCPNSHKLPCKNWKRDDGDYCSLHHRVPRHRNRDWKGCSIFHTLCLVSCSSRKGRKELLTRCWLPSVRHREREAHHHQLHDNKLRDRQGRQIDSHCCRYPIFELNSRRSDDRSLPNRKWFSYGRKAFRHRWTIRESCCWKSQLELNQHECWSCYQLKLSCSVTVHWCCIQCPKWNGCFGCGGCWCRCVDDVRGKRKLGWKDGNDVSFVLSLGGYCI